MSGIRQNSGSVPANSIVLACLVCLCMTAAVTPALAYRPFDGTDAAVADPKEVEIELQPAGLLQEGSQEGSNKTLVAPVLRRRTAELIVWKLTCRFRCVDICARFCALLGAQRMRRALMQLRRFSAPTCVG